MSEQPIYVDYNATTPIDPAVVDEMLPYLREYFGNASSNHAYGKAAKVALERARERVAQCVGALPEEIFFTSGGTESNNLAINGIACAMQKRGKHIITSQVEHPSVLETCKSCHAKGLDVTYLPVDRYGQVLVDSVKRAIRNNTILVTIMHSNNEVGTLQPISEIAEVTREAGVAFHTDAAQSLGKVAVDVKQLGVDMLSIAGHKLYAPKGIGALYLRKGVALSPIMYGANHEQGLRPGTEAIPNIVALGKASQIAHETLERVAPQLLRLRQRLHELLISDVPAIALNGHPTMRLPNTLNVGFPGVKAPDLLAAVPEIAASAGSACHADCVSISPVLAAMGVEEDVALGSIRLSIGKYTTEHEIDEVEDILSSRYYKLMQ